MKVYAVEFRASIELGASDEQEAAEIAYKAVLQETKLLYVEAVTECGWLRAWPIESKVNPTKAAESELKKPELPDIRSIGFHRSGDHYLHPHGMTCSPQSILDRCREAIADLEEYVRRKA